SGGRSQRSRPLHQKVQSFRRIVHCASRRHGPWIATKSERFLGLLPLTLRLLPSTSSLYLPLPWRWAPAITESPSDHDRIFLSFLLPLRMIGGVGSATPSTKSP